MVFYWCIPYTSTVSRHSGGIQCSWMNEYTDEWVNACFICCLPISILYFFSNRASRILHGKWLSSWWPCFPASLSSRCSHVITFWPMGCTWKHGVLFTGDALKEKETCPLFSLFLLPVGRMWHDIWNGCLQAQDGWHLLRMAKQQDLIIPVFLMMWSYCTSPRQLVFRSLSCLEHRLGIDIYLFFDGRLAFVLPVKSGYFPWRRKCTLLQHSCLENPMDRGAWWATVHGVANSQIRLSDGNNWLLKHCLWSYIYIISVLW